MKRIVQFPLENEGAVFVEVETSMVNYDGISPASPNDDGIIERAQQSFNTAFSKVKPAVDVIVKTLDNLKADEVEVEFGLKLVAETGVLFASGSAEANYVVKLKWKNAPSSGSK